MILKSLIDLQSHAGLLGQLTIVLYDDNGFIQTCYKHCHYTRDVRVRYLWPFSDTESEKGAGGAAVTFGVVKTELQRVMYFV
ncbi:unnamed protein product [Rhizophagus irregularis]|nr:unnamed protein product [Rhizophagus irregularis]